MKMYANYHTHTPRCGHAQGAPEEYVRTAIRNGLKILGFSDHVPYPFTNGYVSPVKMAVEETESYVEEIAALREKYRDQIRIFIGYEAEYYPEFFDGMLKNICQYECDYLILGQHFLGNEYERIYSGRETKDESKLVRYVDQTLEAFSTEKFSYLAHPDLIHFTGDDAAYVREMRRLCEGAKRWKMPLEINMLGLMQGRNYPDDRFWSIVREVGNDVVLGCDAHNPDYVGKPELVKLAEDYAKRFDLTPLETIPFKKVK